MNRAIDKGLKLFAVSLILLSIAVSIPLLIRTYSESGGSWGFGLIGFPVLVPLSAYFLFGIAGLSKSEAAQRNWFLSAHVVTLATGIITFIIFPYYPAAFVLIPVLLAAVSFLDRKHSKYLILLMMALGITANILLLKWELDFDRTVPILHLFQTAEQLDP